MLMLCSNRYFKHHWRLNMFLHILSGGIIFILNLIYGLGAIYYKNWQIEASIHGILGTVFSISMSALCLIGIFGHVLYRRLRWKAFLLTKILTVHKVSLRYTRCSNSYSTLLTLFWVSVSWSSSEVLSPTIGSMPRVGTRNLRRSCPR